MFKSNGPSRLIGPASAARAALLAAALLIAACSAQPPPPAEPAAVAAATAANHTVAPKPLMPPDAENTVPPAGPAAPVVLPGTGVFVNPRAAPPVAQAQSGDAGAVSFNFINADVRDVLREILGDQLHVNYTIDSKVQATITAQTGGPLPRSAVLPMLATILESNGLGLVEADGVYRVVPVADAAKAGLGAAAGVKAGYAIRILPLHFVGAGELKGILDPFIPPGAAVQVDTARNLLIVTGPMADLDGVTGLVRQFDVDWLRGTSFALYPLQIGMAKDVATDLNQIFGDGGSGPLAGLVRILPLDRLNAILVISPQRSYLAQVKSWIDRFDYGADEMTPRIFEYHVQNSRAADLAAVLTKLLSSGSVSTVQPTTAPGSKMNSLIPQQNSSGAGASLLGSSSGTGVSSGIGGSSGIGASSGIGGSSGIGTSSAGTGTAGGSGLSLLGQAPQGQAAQTGQSSQDNALAPSGLGGGNTPPGLDLPPVRIVADEKNNALVIYARPHDYRMIEDVIHRLDIVPLQVMIEATIAEVTLNDDLSYGLQFFLQHGASRYSSIAPSATQAAPTNGSGTIADVTAIYPGFNYILSTASQRAILSAISSVTHVNVVSSPQLLVLDHQTAALQVGNEVPIITQQAQSTLTTGAPLVNSVSYQNTGVILQVTPRVNTSGLVALDIDQEVSDVSTTTTSTIDSPTINERRVVSSVVVQDGQTVALGGLIQDNQTKTRSGLPFLSDIPIIGSIFGNNSTSAGRTELLVLISPRIIRNGLDAQAMTDELRDRMKDVKPLDTSIHR